MSYRSYYKCSYHKTQKCLATKQVQRKDEGPMIFEITYKGEHTCYHGAQLATPSTAPSPEKHEITPTQHPKQLSMLDPDESHSIAHLREDFLRFQFPNQYYDELSLDYSPPFNSPDRSGILHR